MFKNFFKIAIRNIKRDKTYSFINVFGLSIGMSAFILIALMLQYMFSYDTFHKNYKRVYRVQQELQDIKKTEWTHTVYPIAQELKNTIPEIEDAAVIKEIWGEYLSSKDDIIIKDVNGFLADPEILNILTFKFIEGDAEIALNNPGSVVISKTLAQKLFPGESAFGKMIEGSFCGSLIVSGIMEDYPLNSHIQPSYFVSFSTTDQILAGDYKGYKNDWENNAYSNFVLLKRNTDPALVVSKIENLLDTKLEKNDKKLYLKPVQEIVYNTTKQSKYNSPIPYYTAISLFILILACINFINLSIAQSNNRANEVGVRKVLGAHKSQLIFQFLGETIISSFLAMLLAIVLVELITPLFNEILEKPLSISLFNNYYGISAIGLVTILTGVISGIFPALFLSNFSPVKIFKKNIGLNFSYEFFRKALVTLQFSISVFLIIAIGIIYQQLDYINSKKLGFDKEKVLFVKSRNDVNKKFDALRNELIKNNSIVNVSATTDIPGKGANSIRFVPEGFPQNDPLMLPISQVTYEFFETMNIKIIEGRSFSREFPSDVKEAFILNKKAVENIGWKDDPVGKKLEMFAAGKNEIGMSGYIVGVVDDYHFESLHTEVKPLVLSLTNNYTYYVIRLGEGSLSSQIDFVESTWKKFSPDWPFEFFFLDKNLEQSYNNDTRLGKLINYFTLLAIFIASMGLFGLVTFAAEKRSKEIGIRKILGASVSSIIKLLAADFVKIVLTANVIAWPVAYYFMNKWLQSFAFRISISWWVFVLAGGIALLIAFATVSSQAIKAATANPVKSLRYE